MKTCSLIQAGRAAACACALSCLSLAAAPAHAALGDAPTVPPGASSHPLAGGAARVVSYVDDGGATVNEYVASASGTVFAYTWQGPTQPNLEALLGRYAADWRSAAAAQHAAGRDDLHGARVVGAQVVVETGGHMRAYAGRAWLPAALPEGVAEGDLQ
ncbi:DUF2844 domain-containing protein [Paraburkholderia unamae]|uniref:Uncharacterized protein DUF2844 n=1 Tax=Paraburkholderia unamae TaxID=219649 RepID=A0ABX5KAC4_9BURK|nr:DUF2844 domain-containing protein [Paraburkholderia unamae]PVX71993.1 uncharacterized protein DUF2844 [Paraburkholderia unamae]RAR52430.1 uncharacterized protein DUF2844 [Paraburkholderia unamae]